MTAPGTARRICVVGSGWRFTSGISYYTCRLANTLAGRHDVLVVLMRRIVPALLYPGRERVGQPVNNLHYDARVRVNDGVDWFWFPSLLKAVREIRRQRPQLLVLQWWTAAVLHSYLCLVVAARSRGSRVVVEFHETQDTGESRLPPARLVLRWIGSAVLRRCDGVVVHSEYDRRAVIEQFPVLADRPLRVVPHGPFDHHVGEPAVPAREDDATELLFFGTIRPYKGLEHLVEAFDGLSDDAAAELRLTIVGETWEGWHLPLTLVETSRHRDRIRVVNRYVHDDEVAAFFAAADAVVLPYTRSSASGPLHIAMAAGLPVVVTDVGGLRDAAEEYEGAVWVPPNDVDALQAALLRLPGLRGRRYRDVRSWDHTMAAYEDLLEEVIRCG